MFREEKHLSVMWYWQYHSQDSSGSRVAQQTTVLAKFVKTRTLFTGFVTMLSVT